MFESMLQKVIEMLMSLYTSHYNYLEAEVKFTNSLGGKKSIHVLRK